MPHTIATTSRTTASSPAISRINGGQGAGPTGLAPLPPLSPPRRILAVGLPRRERLEGLLAVLGLGVASGCRALAISEADAKVRCPLRFRLSSWCEERYLIVAFTVMTDVPGTFGP